LWGVLLGRHPVNNITPFALLIPIVGMASGVILFSEKITLGILIGSAVVMVGLALSVFGDRLVARFRH
jgi:O-acetylserine/cysteine efflux transporter